VRVPTATDRLAVRLATGEGEGAMSEGDRMHGHTLREAADRLGLSVRQVWSRVLDGRLVFRC